MSNSPMFQWGQPPGQPPIPPHNGPMPLDNGATPPPDHAPPQGQNAEIRLVGPRSSGKSAYGVALAAWRPQPADPHSPLANISCVDQDTRSLNNQAFDILLRGEQLERTDFNPQSMPNLLAYTVNISFQQGSAPYVSGTDHLTITFKDYSGELISGFPNLVNQNKDLVDSYIADCIIGDGLVFFVDGTAHYRDAEYSQYFNTFMTELNIATPTVKRIALVVSKCDRGELWGRRYDAETIMQQRFKNLVATIENWQQTGDLDLRYFASSAFGTLGHGNRRQTNCKVIKKTEDGTAAVIAQPRYWRPFGLVSPLYWLATKKMPPRLPGEIEPW